MYAVVKSGGKQYRVANDQNLLVERIEAKEGSVITLEDILMVVENGKILQGNQLEKIAVSASVIKQTRGPKIITLKHRRRKNSRRLKGHRQNLTLLKVVGIGDPSKLVIKKDNNKKKVATSKPDTSEKNLDNKNNFKKTESPNKNEKTKKTSVKKEPNVKSKTKKTSSSKPRKQEK